MGYRYLNKEGILRIPLVFFVGFILLTFLIPIRRIIPDTGLSPFFHDVFNIHFWTPLLLATLVILRQNSPSLNAVAKVKVWNWIVVGLLLLFLVLTIMGVKGLWWTWITLGVHLSTVMLVANATRSKLGDLKSLTLGVGIASFAAGIWEIVFIIGYYQHYDVPQGIDISHLYAQVVQISPLAIGGIGVAIAFRSPKLSWLSTSMLMLSVVSISYWIFGDMWVDVIFDWQKGVYVYTEPFRRDQAILYRSSKATLALGLVGLYGAYYTRGRGIRLR